ncbi:hypothetical protein MTO96_019013 [Rhipicephalus appendiculatus]
MTSGPAASRGRPSSACPPPPLPPGLCSSVASGRRAGASSSDDLQFCEWAGALFGGTAEYALGRLHSATAVRCPLRLMKTSPLNARRTSVISGSGTAVALYSGEPVIRACDAKIKTESRE